MRPIFVQAKTITTILLISLLLSTPTTTTADIVLDSDNDPVVAGSYYGGASVAFTETGPELCGGVTMFNNGTVSSPSFIVSQSDINAVDFFIPIKFTPQISTQKNTNNIYTSSNLNIAFKFLKPEPDCRRRYTTVWTVSGTENGNMVVLDGEEGSDGSWFKLERVDYLAHPVYTILYGNKAVLYNDLQPNGETLLGLEKGYPFLFQIHKIGPGSFTTSAEFLKMSRLRFAQGLLANK